MDGFLGILSVRPVLLTGCSVRSVPLVGCSDSIRVAFRQIPMYDAVGDVDSVGCGYRIGGRKPTID